MKLSQRRGQNLSVLTVATVLISTCSPVTVDAAKLGDRYDTECTDFPACHRLRLVKSENFPSSAPLPMVPLTPRALDMRQGAADPSTAPTGTTTDTTSNNTGSTGIVNESGSSLYRSETRDGLFKFSLNCVNPPSDTNQSFCKNMAATFAVSGEAITRIFKLTQPIKVSGSIIGFCEAAKSGEAGWAASRCKYLLGYAKPSSFYTVTSSEVSNDILFPQALIRERFPGALTSVSGLNEADVQVQFNSDAQELYYFDRMVAERAGTPAPNGSIGSKQYDMRYIVLHELLHGLGLVTFWDTYLAYSQASTNLPDKDKLMLPPLLHSDGKIVGIDKVGIYDFYLASNIGGRLVRWYDTLPSIAEWVKQGLPPSGEGYKLASQLYAAATTPRSTLFLVPNTPLQPSTSLDQYVTIHTENKFLTGTSISHIDQTKYRTTEEFLERPYVSQGETMDGWVARNGGPLAPFGRSTVAMLVGMGYQLNADAKVVMMDYRADATRPEPWGFAVLAIAGWIIL